MKKIWGAFHEIIRTAAWFCYLVILFCVVYQITLRFFFGKNTSWCEEVAQLAYIAACFMGICLVERENAHIRLDILFDWFPKFKDVILDIGRFCTIVYAGVIAYSEWLLRPAVRTVTTKASGIPLKYIHYLIMIACIIWALDALIGFIQTLVNRRDTVEKEG